MAQCETPQMSGSDGPPAHRVVLVRHGQTAWSASGQHTGRTDVPLTDTGRAQGAALAPALGRYRFVRISTSPLSRAVDTCRLALPDQPADVDPDLAEWDYGEYEGLTTVEIREIVPQWTVWTHPCPGGESSAEVAARVDAVLTRCRHGDGDVLLVAHGHLLRVLSARWLGLEPAEGRLFLLDPATISVLADDRGVPVISSWNSPIG